LRVTVLETHAHDAGFPVATADDQHRVTGQSRIRDFVGGHRKHGSNW
jgi:hypothetical protein